jgi:hypothetical protein
MSISFQVVLAELRQARADTDNGPHKLIGHPIMRALWHEFLGSDRVESATFWAVFPARLPADLQRALKPLLQEEETQERVLASMQKYR